MVAFLALGFGDLALRDVTDHAEKVAVRHHRRDHIRGEGGTVFAPELPLPVMVGFAVNYVQSETDLWNLRLGNDGGGVHTDEFITRVTEHATEARIGVHVITFGVGDGNAVRRIFEEGAVTGFAFAQLCFGPFALRDVGADAQKPDNLVTGIAHDAVGPGNPDALAIAAYVLVDVLLKSLWRRANVVHELA